MNGLNSKNIMIEPSKNNTFCYYPFYALTMKLFDGNNLNKVAPCCKMHNVGRSVLTQKEIGDSTPLELFEHDKFEQLRADLLKGIRNENCEVCWSQEDRGLKSYRLTSSWVFEDQFKKDLREFDVSFSNKCNLICRMCNLGGSHQFYKDFSFFSQNKLLNEVNWATSNGVFPKINVNTENNIQLNWLLKNYNYIKVLKITGGEPLYDKKALKLLNIMVENNHAKNVILQFHTNATLLDDENIKLLNNFKQQAHVFSVDGTNKIYEYIRHNSSFDLIETNIFNWLNKSNNIRNVAFNLVLSALNVLDLKNYLEWIGSTFSYKYNIKIHISEIRPFTRGTSLYNVPIDILKISKDRVLQFEKNNKNDLLNYEIKNILTLIDLGIEKNTAEKNFKKLKTEIEMFDKSRGQNYRDFLDPVLIKILEDV